MRWRNKRTSLAEGEELVINIGSVNIMAYFREKRLNLILRRA